MRRSLRQFLVVALVAVVVLVLSGAGAYVLFRDHVARTVVGNDASALLLNDSAYMFVPPDSDVTDPGPFCDSGLFYARRTLHSHADAARIRAAYEHNLATSGWRRVHPDSYARSLDGRSFVLTVNQPDEDGDIPIVVAVKNASLLAQC